jgi:hypothetical protein
MQGLNETKGRYCILEIYKINIMVGLAFVSLASIMICTVGGLL